MARTEAVRDGNDGIALRNLPGEVTERADNADRLAALYRYARNQERGELLRHRSRGICRTHYTAKLSFESSLDIVEVKRMALSWLETVLPEARAVVFFHRNTAHLHAHVWIEARQTDGRKINLSARAYRQLDEAWNRLYAAALGRDENDHLHKKWETEAYKAMRRQGREVTRPERVAHQWEPAFFNERERERLGINREEKYDGHESGIGGNQPAASGDHKTPERGERVAPHSELSVDRVAGLLDAADRDADRAVSEARALHEDAARLVERERNEREIESRERDRGR